MVFNPPAIPRLRNSAPGIYRIHRAMFFRLKDVCPTGMEYKHTGNRVELCTIIAGLSFAWQKEEGLESWKPKGATRPIMITDSTYVVDGVAKWVKTWEKNGCVYTHLDFLGFVPSLRRIVMRSHLRH